MLCPKEVSPQVDYRRLMFILSKMAVHEVDVFSLTDIAEIQQAYAQIHLHEVSSY